MMFLGYNLGVSEEIAGKQVGIVQSSFVCLASVPPWALYQCGPVGIRWFWRILLFFLMEREKEELRSSSASLFPAGDSDPWHSRPPVTFTHSHLCPLSTRVCHSVHVGSLDPLFLLSLCYIASIALSLGRQPASSVVQLSCQYWDFSKSAWGHVSPCKSPMVKTARKSFESHIMSDMEKFLIIQENKTPLDSQNILV